MLVSILIPTFERPNELKDCLRSFSKPLSKIPPDQFEVIIRDNSTSEKVEELIRKFDFGFQIDFKKNRKNLGAEKNLISCLEDAQGDYVWFFGDDDILLPEIDLLSIFSNLERNAAPLLLLNRAQASSDMTKIINGNYFETSAETPVKFNKLREVFESWGMFSSVGFIGSNIIKRQELLVADLTQFLGFNYPHVGALCEGFIDKPVLMEGRPVLIQRTWSSEQHHFRAKSDEAAKAHLFSVGLVDKLSKNSIEMAEMLFSNLSFELAHQTLHFREKIWGRKSLGELIFFSYFLLQIISIVSFGKVKVEPLNRTLTLRLSFFAKFCFMFSGAFSFAGGKARLFRGKN